ncbi:centrosomal protein of 104 kDa isoform X2 [Myripristis murdjan]|uniref:centrosomal protein of 104 kDa isoform X2 n=1 Tax=Myripristis murdjan TaxID=586833 RepID=UPI001175CC09|nr:centrosomal protein of 104 kDa isoform X2 [Myripristis murdjan]
MTRKIGFIVVSSSGHEDNFSATELMVHAPSVSGWRSTRLCSYPQQITIQLVERCRVRKLQLLAHQYLIPTKVEFHIGDTLPDASTPGLAGHFRRLGYVCLSDNEKTGFKARELKSIHVDAIGLYLRITFHRNHVNRYNLYNQVALVAINVLGDSLDGNAFNTIPSREQLIEHYLNTTQLDATLDTTYMGKCESISPLDDLAFDMYQDPEVAHIIRLLDQRKQDMVRQEKFELAKSLKQAIADLQKVGEHLARYDVEKRCAIEKEDYDLAKRKKEQMEEYRKTVYQQLEVHNLLDMATITKTAESSSTKDPPSLLPSPGHHSVVTKPHISSETNRRGRKSNLPQEPVPEPVTVTPKPTNQSATPCSHAALPRIDVNSVPYDERPLPTLQRKDRPEEATPSPAEEHSDTQGSPYSSRTPGELEPLTEKAQREASLPIEVYGDGLVAGAYSKSWSHREDALLAVYKKLMEVLPATPKEELRKIIRAAVFLVKRGLPDKVSSVFQASLKLLRLLLSQLIPGLGLGRAEVAHCLEQTWPNLLARTGDSSSRIRATATAFIQEIAALKEVRVLQVIPSELVKPFKSNFPTRLAQSRTELLEKLLADLGTESSGFTLDNVMTFCTGALEHNASVVRELAVRIVLSMYQQHRNAVLSFLPANDAATRKNILYKNLFDSFARIDGRLVETQTQKKRDGQQDGQQEKEEIRSLQEQLAALKEISEKGNERTKAQTRGKEAPMVEKESPKAGKTGVTQECESKLSATEYDQPSVVNYLDNLCIFCGKKDESFTEDGLDLHYWKHCPMLRRCDECRQVVEIASLTEHLLGECESRSKFSQCPRCSEAVATDDLARHTQGPACNPPVSGKGSNHCPLCHNNFRPGEEAWKAHLMGREGCKQNSRRTAVCQRTQPAQGKAVGGARLKQAWSVGARAKPLGRGSRIPALAPRASRHTPGKH